VLFELLAARVLFELLAALVLFELLAALVFLTGDLALFQDKEALSGQSFDFGSFQAY
jgi:hypothetical protein